MNDKMTKIEFSVELDAKACPFCGSWDLNIEEIEDSDWPLYVACNKCNGGGPNEVSWTKAVERWNERKTPDPVPEKEA
jgi:Lar family restriction alleviation protein